MHWINYYYLLSKSNPNPKSKPKFYSTLKVSNLPIHKSLLNNQSLSFISGNLVVKPWLGPMDGWRNKMNEYKGLLAVMQFHYIYVPHHLVTTCHQSHVKLPISSVTMARSRHTHVCGRGLWGGSGSTVTSQVQTSFFLSKEWGWNKLKLKILSRKWNHEYPPSKSFFNCNWKSFGGIFYNSAFLTWEVHCYQGVLRYTSLEKKFWKTKQNQKTLASHENLQK